MDCIITIVMNWPNDLHLNCMLNFIVMNWPNDLHLNCMLNLDLKDYIKVDDSLAKENYNLIESTNIFEHL